MAGMQELMVEAAEFTRCSLVDRSFGLTALLPHPNDVVMLERKTSEVKRLPYNSVRIQPCQDEVLYYMCCLD